jgi:hypothetical protein
LDVDYGHQVKKYLLENCRSVQFIVFDPIAAAAFPGVLTTSVITLGVRGELGDMPVRVVHVRRMAPAAEIREALSPESGRTEFDWGTVDQIPREKLSFNQRWSTSFSGRSAIDMEEGSVTLGSLATVKRGVATGANSFFVLSSAAARSAGISRRFLRPAMGNAKLLRAPAIRLRDFARWSSRGERVWLLDIRTSKSKSVKKYLLKGKRLGVHLGQICRNRSRWYEMERREVPPILATYMSKGGPRFAKNLAGLVPLNVFHGVYPKDLSPHQVNQLLSYLNSDEFREKVARGGRIYSSGLIKVEPRELMAISVPDVRCIPTGSRSDRMAIRLAANQSRGH